ncbi:alpha/beta fold hydrolase [Dyadobacter chenhuakuii]|uniref:Alpha/beta hydrolase n=1 Tax=Dyadobacter chenhuakuii TaxID=2909339 RepID=A0A9X1QFR2_9BACT|nr:alpha/beta hydrolase [Dyadobacter chenhuakuii]MCF2495406.1 alpha/beta hydrolase [Dyadobacter chenhuakuii]MCF2500129.1 alpha/beta hydrolase [Dyadobacter chenhuakuii]USJ29444.1 alpha/beta hydrolase [Dyadobacter chenhuakuii]
MSIKILTILTLLASTLSAFSQEKMVSVNGVNYHVLTSSLEQRKLRQPVLVFENGMGMGFGNWDTITDSLAKNAPVFLYDRQGVEKSDKVFQMPTPQKIAANLKSLLQELKVEPPYILVGHSMGGVYARAFAGYYPDAIAGLVFVDPADFTETKADWNQIFRTIGVSEKRIEEMLINRLYTPSKADSSHYASWSEGQVLTDLRKTDFAELSSLPIPQVPILFFVGGKLEVPKERRSKEYDHERFFEEKNSSNMLRWRRFIHSSSKGGALIYLSNSGHFVHRDDAAMVIGNIRMMINALEK